jgi:AraC-like DNA-binding protein
VFRGAVGLPPKIYGRVVRFQRAVERIVAEPGASLTDVAFAAGYSDQPHFTRDFREFAGVSPGDYRGLSPRSGNHVPLHPPRR